jgi:hypothetical protein
MKQILCGWLILGQILLSAGLPMNAHAGPKVSEQTICEQVTLAKTALLTTLGVTYNIAMSKNRGLGLKQQVISAFSGDDASFKGVVEWHKQLIDKEADLKIKLINTKNSEQKHTYSEELSRVQAEIKKERIDLKRLESEARSSKKLGHLNSSLLLVLLTVQIIGPCGWLHSNVSNPTAHCTRPKSSITPEDLDHLMDPKTCVATLKEKLMLYQELQAEYLKAEMQAKKMSQNKNTKPAQNKNNPTGSIDSGSNDTESAQGAAPPSGI